MGRQPPVLGADDNPPSPLPPATPYTEPPTPLNMPDSPVALPRSLSPRLRPLRRLAARKDLSHDRLASRTRHQADGSTPANSSSPSPPPNADAQNASEPHLPQKDAAAASEGTPPAKSPETDTRSLAEKAPPSDADACAPVDNSDIVLTQPAQQSVSNPSEMPKDADAAAAAAAAAASSEQPPKQPPTASLPSAAEDESNMSHKHFPSDKPLDDSMNDNHLALPSPADQQPSLPEQDQSESGEQPPEPSQPADHQRHPSPSREQDISTQPATRRLALSDSALQKASDKLDLMSAEPAPLDASNKDNPPADRSTQVDEAMPEVERHVSPERGAQDNAYSSSPANITAQPSLTEPEAQMQEDVIESNPDKSNNNQPPPPPLQTPPSPNVTSEPQPMSVEVIDLAEGATQQTQASSKTPRLRQLAVRSDFNKSERRRLAVRTQEPEEPPRESSATPLSSSPDISKVFRSAPNSGGRKRLSSPEEFVIPLSRYGTRSATKERESLPTRSRARRQSEPVHTLISERTRRRRKPQVRPVKGDKLRVLWHIDLLYYEGVVDSVLSYRGKQFYDVTYDSGEKEFYLDLSTRKWRFADGRDGNDSDDSIPDPQELPDYSEFPKIGDKVLVMWHVDGKYYPGTVQDILKTSNGWFYDVIYEGGDREFFLDLHVRKWKYGWSESKKRKAKISKPARRPPREKVKRAARKSTGGGSSAYVPPPSSSMDTGESLVVESVEHQPSRSLRKVESLLEEKERREQERRAREEQKKKVIDLRRIESKRAHAIAQEREEQLRIASSPKRMESKKDPASGLQTSMSGVGAVVVPKPSISQPPTELHPTQPERQEEPVIVLDLPELEDDTFETMLEDIGAPLAPPPAKKRPRSQLPTFGDDEQIKRKKSFFSGGKDQSLVVRENLESPAGEDLGDDAARIIGALHNPLIEDVNMSNSVPSPQMPSLRHHGQLFASNKQSHLPPNAAPPARKTVQQRARSTPRAQLTPQHVLQSEPDFIPRPRSVSRARSRSRRPPSQRRTDSPHSLIERRRLMSKDRTPAYTPATGYAGMRPSAHLPQRRMSSAKKAKTTVADIVSVSGLVAKRWIEENTKQFSVNLKNMENELNKMKANHAKQMKTEKVRLNRATAQQPKKAYESDISDEEKDVVLGGVRSEFMGLITRYRTVVERREQVLMQQFARFRKTLGSQNSKLVSTGKQLEKLDIRGLKALDNLQPITRSRLDIPHVPPRQSMNISAFKSPLPLLHHDTVQVRQSAESLRDKPVDRSDKSDAVAKSLRRKLADLVTRSDWLSEEVKRLQKREKLLVREKREALAELNKMRAEKSSPLSSTTPSSGSRALPARSTSARASERPPPKFTPSKPVGIVKNRTMIETRSSGRNAGRATRKNLPHGNTSYKSPAHHVSSQPQVKLKSSMAGSSNVVPGVHSKSIPLAKPVPMPKQFMPSKPFMTPMPTPMEDVAKPKVSEAASTEIEKGSNFTDELGKSMDKQAWELLALIFTIWLLQDEGRSEPPKQPGEKMDSWVRACVINCLKHARIYLDATSGITTARRSLMHDVDGESVYVEWILGDSDETFERARSNYSLWEPTLLDVEWLAEKRVLLGLSICYKKAWGETSARQYETSLMYAKAIAHKAVSNFELYMPHTIVLGATLAAVPSGTETKSQLPASQSEDANLQDESMTLNKTPGSVSGSGAVTLAKEAAVQPVTQPSNLAVGQPSIQRASLPRTGNDVVEQPTNNAPSKLETATSQASEFVKVTLLTSRPVPLSQTPLATPHAATEAALATTQNETPLPGSTDQHATVAGQERSNNAAVSSGMALSPPPSASRTDTPMEPGRPKSQGTREHGTDDRMDSTLPSSANENADEVRNVPNTSDEQPQGGTCEGDMSDGKDKTSLTTPAVTDLTSSEVQGKFDENASSPTIPPSTAAPSKPVKDDLDGSKDVDKGTTSPSKPASSGQDVLTSANESEGNRTEPSVAENEDRSAGLHSGGLNAAQQGRNEEARNPDSNGIVHPIPGDNPESLSKKSTASVVTMTGPNASQTGSNERTTPTSSQVTLAPHLPSTIVVTSMGANSSVQIPSALQRTPIDGLSMRIAAGKGNIVTDQRQSKNTELSSGNLGLVRESGPKTSQPAQALPRESAKGASGPSVKGLSSSALVETTKTPTIGPGSERVAERALRSSKSLGSQAASETPSQPNMQVPKPPNPPTKRSSKSAIGKGAGSKGKKPAKSVRKGGASGRGRASRTSARVKDPTSSMGSPRIQRKGTGAESEASLPKTAGMIGLMRLPGAPPTVPQTESRIFPTPSLPAESLATRQPVGMKRLPQMPASIMSQRRILSGVDPAEFDSLPSPIPRRHGMKGVSDDTFSHSMPYATEQQSNLYTPNGKWNSSQQPVQRKGYKSLSLMPPMSQQNAPTAGQPANPFDARAVASPFEYNRTGDQGMANEARAEAGHESGYHVVEQVDMMNPPTPAALSALDYGVEQAQRDTLPSTTEFQERFDRGYDPYRSQIGHIMNTMPREGFGVGRNVHAKEYGKR